MPGARPGPRGRGRPRWKSAAIIGFTSAIAAYGAFFIPKAYGISIALTGGAGGRALGFLRLLRDLHRLTWAFYTRRGGLLHDIERGRALRRPPRSQPTKKRNTPMSHLLDR